MSSNILIAIKNLVESPVIEEIADIAVKELSSHDLFDSKFNLIVEFLNKIKLVYE